MHRYSDSKWGKCCFKEALFDRMLMRKVYQQAYSKESGYFKVNGKVTCCANDKYLFVFDAVQNMALVNVRTSNRLDCSGLLSTGYGIVSCCGYLETMYVLVDDGTVFIMHQNKVWKKLDKPEDVDLVPLDIVCTSHYIVTLYERGKLFYYKLFSFKGPIEIDLKDSSIRFVDALSDKFVVKGDDLSYIVLLGEEISHIALDIDCVQACNWKYFLILRTLGSIVIYNMSTFEKYMDVKYDNVYKLVVKDDVLVFNEASDGIYRLHAFDLVSKSMISTIESKDSLAMSILDNGYVVLVCHGFIYIYDLLEEETVSEMRGYFDAPIEVRFLTDNTFIYTYTKGIALRKVVPGTMYSHTAPKV